MAQRTASAHGANACLRRAQISARKHVLWLAAVSKQLRAGPAELAMDHQKTGILGSATQFCCARNGLGSFQSERRPQDNAQGLPYLAKMAHHAAPQGLPQRLADELDAARKAAAEACTAFLADTTLSMHTVARAFNELQQSAAAAAVSNSGAPVDATFAVRPDVKGDVRPTTAARLLELHNLSPQGLWALIVLDFGMRGR